MTVNNELNKLGEWFKTNKTSFNIEKAKYTFSHKNSVKDDIPLKLPELKIANWAMERTNAITFFIILLDENIAWTNRIRSAEKKLAQKYYLVISSKILTL